MKIDIIVVYTPRYQRGHEKDFVPPISAIHLAALTPERHTVRVVHQQVEKIDFKTDADLVALSFFSGFAIEAYRLADLFRKLGKTVIAGGPHVTFNQEESLQYFDSIVVGEAESVWLELLLDYERSRLKRSYQGDPVDLSHVPTPRYDLLSDNFFVKRVVQATRGCPYHCSFCTVPRLNPGFRTRPVSSVINDIKYDSFKHWWQRKIVWFWDDNLTINRRYIKSLLREMIPLKKWWLTQASIDICEDSELLKLMKQSGCIGIFLGIETFSADCLKDANKRHNHLKKYKKAIQTLHDHGICVMAGLIAGFDHDTPETIVGMSKQLMKLGIDVPFLSILTPYKGTPLYTELKSQSRIIAERDWRFYNGYNVSFQPKLMSAGQLQQAHRTLWKKCFGPINVAVRILRSLLYLRFGAACMCLFMNGFYGLKRVSGNYPCIFEQEPVSEDKRKEQVLFQPEQFQSGKDCHQDSKSS